MWPPQPTRTGSRWWRWASPGRGSGGWPSSLIPFPTGWTPTVSPWPRLKYSPSPTPWCSPWFTVPWARTAPFRGCWRWPTCPMWGRGCWPRRYAWTSPWPSWCAPGTGLPQCRHQTASSDDPPEAVAKQAIAEMGLPLFVKPANMGSSVGVSRTTTEIETIKAIRAAAQYDETLIIEEAVTGQEIEVSVLGNRDPKASIPGEIVPGADFYDYADKYLTDGAKLLVPAQISEAAALEAQRLAISAYRALRCEGMARVDFLYEPRWPRNAAQRDQHHSRVHPHKHVPQAVASIRPPLPGAHLHSGRPGRRALRAPRPTPPHRPMRAGVGWGNLPGFGKTLR